MKSLFTKIPIDFALSSLEKLLDENQDWKQRTALEKEDIIELTRICLESTIFQYNNNLYQQINGTPMGSSISGTIAEITMQAIEKEILERSPTDIKLWRRFVDDVISIIPRDQIQETHTFINSVHSDIQFEVETERVECCMQAETVACCFEGNNQNEPELTMEDEINS